LKSKEECAACLIEAVKLDLIASLCQIVFKSLVAQLTGSVSLGVSSLVSLGDFITKIIAMASIKIARLPPSSRFPYGYGKIQFLSSMIIGLALMAGAVIILVDNIWLVEQAHSAPPSLLALLAVIISALASEILYRYLFCVGTRNKNSSLLTAAMDSRLDSVSGVIVFIGIACSHLGFEDADYWAAVLISFIVFYVGGKIFYEALKSLLDISIPEEVIEQIYKISRRTSGVVEVEYCRARSLGETWELNLQIAVDQDLSSQKIKHLNESLRQDIQQSQTQPHFSFIQISNNLVEKVNDDDEDIFKLFKENS